MSRCQHSLQLNESPFWRRSSLLILGRRLRLGLQIPDRLIRHVRVYRPWVNVWFDRHTKKAGCTASRFNQDRRGQCRAIRLPFKVYGHLCIHDRMGPQSRTIRNYRLGAEF